MEPSIAALKARLARSKSTTKRIAIYKQLIKSAAGEDLAEAELLALSMLDECLTVSDMSGMYFSRIRLGEILYKRGRFSDALLLFESAIGYFSSIGDCRYEAQASHGAAVIKRAQGDLNQAITLSLHALSIQESIGDWEGYIQSANLAADIWLWLSDFNSAAKYIHQGLLKARENQLKRLESKSLSTLATIEQELDNFESAYIHQLAALQIRRQTGPLNGIACNLLNLGQLCLDMRRWDEAKDSLLEAQKYFAQLGATTGIIECHQNLATLYCEIGEYELATTNVMASLTLSKECGLLAVHRLALAVLARIMQRTGKRNEAKDLYIESHNLFCGFEDYSNNHGILEELVSECRQTGDFENALYYEKKLIAISEFGRQQRRHRELEREELRIAQLEQDRQRQLRMAQQATSALASQMQEVNQITKELEHRREFLLALRNEITQMEKHDSSNLDLKRVRAKIDRQLAMDDNKNKVDLVLAQLHPLFAEQLSALHPELSKAEIRICMFLCLNLQTSEIATIIRSSPRTIEVHRAKIRKKLKLSRDVSLKDYFQQFEESLQAV